MTQGDRLDAWYERTRWYHPFADQVCELAWEAIEAGPDGNARRFFRAAGWVGRNLTPPLLRDWYWDGLLPPEELRAVLPDAWSAPNWPEAQLGRGLWLEMFRTAGWVDSSGGAPPCAPLTVHRGAPWGRRRGMAWSTDLKVAVDFACRWPDAMVWTVTVEPSAVVAAIGCRNEYEVVVDPARLPPIRRSCGRSVVRAAA